MSDVMEIRLPGIILRGFRADMEQLRASIDQLRDKLDAALGQEPMPKAEWGEGDIAKIAISTCYLRDGDGNWTRIGAGRLTMTDSEVNAGLENWAGNLIDMLSPRDRNCTETGVMRMNETRHENPISAAIAQMHPDAEGDFYRNARKCETIGQLTDLAFNFMHVAGRARPINWKRFMKGQKL